MKKKIDFNKYITEHITDILGEDSIQKGYLKKFQKNFGDITAKPLFSYLSSDSF